MATPPTRVSHNPASTGNYSSSTTPKTTASFNVEAGDLLVVMASSEHAGATFGTPSASGGSVTWTLRQTATNTPADQWSRTQVWTGAVGATATGITVSLTRAGTAVTWGLSCTVWRGHGGVGVSGNATQASGNAPAVTLAGCSANSAVQCAVNDWNAADGASRTYRTINGSAMTESTYYRNAAAHTVYGGYRLDVGAGGSVVVGLTAPTAQKPSTVGIEILGTTSGSTVNGVATGSFGFAGTAAGVDRARGLAAAALGGTFTAAGVDRARGVAAAALGFTGTAQGVDRALGAAAAAFGGTFTAQGTTSAPPVAGQAAAAFGGTFTAAGVDRARGQAAAAFGGTFAAAGVDRARGLAVATFGGTLAAAAVRRRLGQALASLGFTATAAGTIAAPPGTGSASAAFGFTATAQGVDRARGQATAAFGFTAAAAGAPRLDGTATATFGFTAAAAGVDRAVGVAVAAFGFTGTAVGAGDTPAVDGAAVAVLGFTATIAGRRRVVAVAVAQLGFSGSAAGLNLSIVTPAARTVVVPAENRTTVVPAENRTVVVPADPRQEA